MTVNNRENRCEKGLFAPGNTIAKKKRDRTQTGKLLEALKKVGKKRNQKFWRVVAEKAFTDKEIMKAIIGKLIPNLQEISGKDGSPINISYKEFIYEPQDNNGE